MTKVYIAIEAKTNKEVFRGDLKQWDHFFSTTHTRLGTWVVEKDDVAEKVVKVFPSSPCPLLGCLRS